jgi:glycosyltransferase involved in cell wall biosynthesis
MKVCMVAYTFYEGDNRVMRYAEALAGRGDHVDVISVGKKNQARFEVLNGVRIFRIQTRQKDERHQLTHLYRVLLFLLRASIIAMLKHLRNRYDVFHIHSVPDFLVVAGLLPRMTGARVILDIHDILPELYASKFGVGKRSMTFRALRFVERTSAACADYVIAPNHIWRDKLVDRSVDQNKCVVFMNYPDPSIFSPRGRSRQDGKIILLYPGTLNWHQGVDLAIRAFAMQVERFPNSEFHVYGEGPEKANLRQLAADLGIGNQVRFRDPLPLREIAAVSENADLGIIPKRSNGFGDEAFSTKSLEFMMLGVPIIIADTKVDRLYFSSKVVTFFHSGDVENLAEAIQRLMEDEVARNTQAARAREFVERYSWASRQKDYLRLVDKLLDKNKLQEPLLLEAAPTDKPSL